MAKFRYWRIMDDKEFNSLLSGKTLNRTNRKQWFDTTNVFYALNKQYGLDTLISMAQQFLSLKDIHYLVEFESSTPLAEITRDIDDYGFDAVEAIFKSYSRRTLRPIRFKSTQGLDKNEALWCNWIYNQKWHKIKDKTHIRR